MEYLLKTAITCEKCVTGPGDYQLDEGNNTFGIAAQFRDFPRVTESVRLKPGILCKPCLLAALQKKSDFLFDRERTRWLYHQEVVRRQAAHDPFRCSDCKLESDEFVYTPGHDQQPVGRCRPCLYAELRIRALKSAVLIPNGRARSLAILNAMEDARERTTYLFDFVWA
jgi:hypothetical protein